MHVIKGIKTQMIKAPGSTSRCPKFIKKMFKCSRLLKKNPTFPEITIS